jgi:hypothetical protein
MIANEKSQMEAQEYLDDLYSRPSGYINCDLGLIKKR